MSVIPAACLIGWPAAHSRSPLIHKYWLQAFGIAGDYRIEAVPPEAFAEFVASLAARGYRGANVTIPHKEQALVLSAPDARARAVGAANTLYFDGDTLRSTNTDVEGFIANLDAAAPGWDTAREALVLGAGGSARAVVFGLLERGIALLAFQMRLVRIPAAEVKAGAHLKGEQLLHAAGGDIDNMEALAVHTAPDGTTRITLVSDNNFNDWERNLLLEFSLPD